MYSKETEMLNMPEIYNAIKLIGVNVQRTEVPTTQTLAAENPFQFSVGDFGVLVPFTKGGGNRHKAKTLFVRG